MLGIFIALPYLLLTHNLVDFESNGANGPYKNRLNCVITEYIEILEAQNNLRLVNKTGCFGEKIDYIALQFETTSSYNLSGSRNLLLGLMETLLTTLNSNTYLKPYLPHCALTSDKIEIRIHFIGDCKYNYPSPNDISYAVFKGGWLSYYQLNTRCLDKLELIKEEPLELAKGLAPEELYSKDCKKR